MANTPNLQLPYLDAAQSQKHVTHNAALKMLDALVDTEVVDWNVAAPPATPANGQKWIVGASATGAWIGKSSSIAAWQDGAWAFYPAKKGWIVWVDALSSAVVWNGASWVTLASIAVGSPNLLAQAAHGGKIEACCDEQLVTLSGATTSSTVVIPNGALVIAVSNLVVTAITGATSYSCGTSGNAGQFGSSLGVAAGSTNRGLIGPNPFYADTPILYTAAGGNFTGGQVRMTIHYFMASWATS